MVTITRIERLDRYFYRDHNARRKDFFLSILVGVLGVMIGRSLGYTLLVEMITCAVAILLTLIARLWFYGAKLKSRTIYKTSPRPLTLQLGVLAALVGATALSLRQGVNSNTHDVVSEAAVSLSTARLNHQKIPRARLKQLSSTIEAATNSKADSPETWQAAYQLINYQSFVAQPTPASGKPDCLRETGDDPIWQFQHRNNPIIGGTFFFGGKDCTLDLDDRGDFDKTAAGRFFLTVNAVYPKNPRVIVLFNAVIKYSGGSMVPIDGLQCENCTFYLSGPNNIPPKPIQSLTRQLLLSNLQKVKVDLVGG